MLLVISCRSMVGLLAELVAVVEGAYRDRRARIAGVGFVLLLAALLLIWLT